MKYCSTRGEDSGSSFQHVLFHSFASNSGLFMPELIPTLDINTLNSWSKLSYIELCQVISRLFIAEDEISTVELNELIFKAFSSNRFDHKDIISIEKVQQDLSILELWHGPTMAFKDLALACVAQFMSFFNRKNKRHVTVVVSTSGDTGSAAIESIRGLCWVDIIVMFPKSRCSKIQELQMTTVLDKNVHVIRGEGTCDDLDMPLRKCLTDQSLVETHGLCSINSLSWARIMIQVVPYFYAFFQANGGSVSGKVVEMVVPTGSAGNITAGVIAYLMGLPIKLFAVTNVNDIFHRGISTGDFSPEEVVQTISPAMDIQTAYNMERIVYLFSESDQVAALMKEFERDNKMSIPLEIRKKMSSILRSQSVGHEDAVDMLKKSWFEWHYLIDPHTALAMFAAIQLQKRTNDTSPFVVFSTAHADKFPEAMAIAGIDHKPCEKIESLSKKPTKFQEMTKDDNWDNILLDIIYSIAECNK